MIKILIVEDDETNRFIMLKHLQEIFSCDSAVDGSETLKKVASTRYDVILMDINLGNDRLSGEILMRIIKMDPNQVDAKIIAITSYAMQGDREHFLDAGFDIYLSKPIMKDVLIGTVHRALIMEKM